MFSYFTNSPRKNSNLQMLYQFRDTLQANLLSVPADDAVISPTMAALRNKTQQILDAATFTWAAAYQAEKMLAHIRPKESLTIEITKQISALAKLDLKAADLFSEELKALTGQARPKKGAQSDPAVPPAKASTPETQPEQPAPKPNEKEAPPKNKQTIPAKSKPLQADAATAGAAVETPSQNDSEESPDILALRHLLERVLNDVHWKYSQRYYIRLIVDRYSMFVFFTGAFLALLFFGTLLLIGYMDKGTPDVLNWSFSGFFLVVVAGLLGASFSVLNRDRSVIEGKSIEETMLQTGFANVFLRIGIGGISAAILYFFFNAGLLTGTLLPNLETIGFTPLSNTDTNTKPLGILVPNADLSKLLVWSFIAGFFQQFVPNALDRVKQGQEKPEPGKGSEIEKN
ncbi:hypothetical protein [Pseudophaeobacter sp. EL27]|uniref:hypothetical protein n=1 Tax=Pseudophaeobacter sp. EL27 TaxID=2107580 RepID=UPI000EFB2447|nr:hypothetical protein [Pseudophaeobacter sp. EL27]